MSKNKTTSEWLISYRIKIAKQLLAAHDVCSDLIVAVLKSQGVEA